MGGKERDRGGDGTDTGLIEFMITARPLSGVWRRGGRQEEVAGAKEGCYVSPPRCQAVRK